MDGGSTDNTKEVVRPYFSDQRVRYIYKKDRSPAEGRNNGIEISKEKYGFNKINHFYKLKIKILLKLNLNYGPTGKEIYK